MHRGCCRHAVQRGSHCAIGFIASSNEDVTVGSTHLVGTRQRKALHILVNEFADSVVAQNAGLGHGELGNVETMLIKGDAGHLIIFLADGLDHPSGSHSTWSGFGRGVDDFTHYQHLGRTAGIHIHNLVHIGAHLAHDLASLIGRTA